ncbi:hypothetical protein [Pseudobacteriovorax antillogorgiicola]|uniref:Uncharacterized protein n=2 Tax=Pseudobacteriovorax antillogorgiicola TaxID=1513793 RepID=A0A1Y6B559_9BACT|nr:hypothetical protein [Pseudobacteriovorax antillogorgiicola]TCS59257.1 hypothetical protein EDD56_101162 [Pseudobacteriovorax antillogorgiicola]SME89978.1 hypothetical protein SAMN06296036_101324 [Pseudobacteriovorax antillogorgiicola]
MKSLWLLFSFLLSGVLSSSCEEKKPTGLLLVKAPTGGTYEIYRVAGEAPLQFVAEEIGSFNQPTELLVGTYLILADCSHKMVNISHNDTHELTAHSVKFVPPHETQPDDKFSVQCDRFSKTKSRQNIRNRYQLNILHGKRDLLVGMVPLRIDFKIMEQPKQPKELSYDLSAIQLNGFDGMKPKTLYFVSPADNLISVTENQEFGHWLYLLPGRYIVEVNGTRREVTLKQGESLRIDPGFVRVSTSHDLNIDLSSNILGTPLYVALNEHHWLDLNETYPVLPGKGTLKLNSSITSVEVDFVANQLVEKKARSVTVESDCPPWDWNCLGRREIFLYEGEKPYAFTEGIADVPILFFETNVWVSIQGSRDIRYQLKDDRTDFRLKIGLIKLTPKHFYRASQYTDLARIEAAGLPMIGHTLDLPLDREITVPLVEGKYFLDQYISLYSQDYERRRVRRSIFIEQGKIPEVSYKVYVSEKRLKKIRKAQARRDDRPQPTESSKHKHLSQTIIPIEFQ